MNWMPRFCFGEPRRRMGLVTENWHKTPDTNYQVMALPKDTEWELIRHYGFFLGKYFIGIQRFAHKRDRESAGFKFGPDANILDLIRNSVED